MECRGYVCAAPEAEPRVIYVNLGLTTMLTTRVFFKKSKPLKFRVSQTPAWQFDQHQIMPCHFFNKKNTTLPINRYLVLV